MFIEIHKNGEPNLININFIESVLDNSVYVADGAYRTDETYEELKLKIELASIHNCEVRAM